MNPSPPLPVSPSPTPPPSIPKSQSEKDVATITPLEINTLIAYFTPSLFEGCAPLEVDFYNGSVNAESYEWSFGTEYSGQWAVGSRVRFVYEEAGIYTVTLIAENEDGLQLSHSEQITVHPKPTAEFEITDDIIYNYSINATQYNWYITKVSHPELVSGPFSTDFQPDLKATSHLTPNTSHLLLIATTPFGCSDTALLPLPLSPSPHLTFPSAFSPNSTGSPGGYYNANEPNNQIFYPKYNEQPMNYYLQVFNKIGEMIFESRDLEIGWDGYYKEAPAAQGVYIYQCTGAWKNGDPYNYRGDITILWND